MKIVTTTRRIESTEQANEALDELARVYHVHVEGNCYDESAARSMSEFDALKWTTLCAQRNALQKREYEDGPSDWKVPARFLGIYETRHCSEPVRLENTDESMSELAA
jgi:hypothetical protein